MPDTWVNGDRENRLCNTSNIGFKGVDARTMIRDMHDIAVSTRSACSSGDSGPSHVLKAIGLSDEDAYPASASASDASPPRKRSTTPSIKSSPPSTSSAETRAFGCRFRHCVRLPNGDRSDHRSIVRRARYFRNQIVIVVGIAGLVAVAALRDRWPPSGRGWCSCPPVGSFSTPTAGC